jgi:hypothetical protein
LVKARTAEALWVAMLLSHIDSDSRRFFLALQIHFTLRAEPLISCNNRGRPYRT